MSNRNDISRRSLLRVMSGMGASLVIGIFPSVSCASAENAALGFGSADTKADAPPLKKAGVVFEPSAFVKIDPDGTVTIAITRSDMGQGVRTSLAMLVAEELDIDWKNVRVIQADSNAKFGRQGTGGSSSIRGLNHSLRQAGATARAMLVAAAAKQWDVDPSTVKTVAGVVVNPKDGKSIPYADLTAAAAGQPLPSSGVQLKDPSEFKIIGKPTTRVDNRDVVMGKALYGIDAKIPGMVYAVIARPPSFGGELESYDDTAARKVHGVVDIQKFRNGIAVLGTNTWAAISGRDALKIVWKPGPNADVSSKSIRDSLVAAVIDHVPVPAGMKVVEATYDLPFLAHATMEPMNAVAEVKDGSCTLWAPTQVPNQAQSTAAQAAGVPNENVTVNVTLLGGGFGRRLQTDFISEAVGLSKQTGKPIKLLWTREDDMHNDFYRPMCHCSMKGALDESGTPVVWSHQALQANGDSGAKFGGAGLPYRIKTAQLRFGGAGTPIPTGPWRSVENTLLTVANECFIDEMAHAAGKDPFEFRRDLIQDDRLRTVLNLVAEKSGWGTPLPKGHARGIACFSGYGTCVAHVVELSVIEGNIKLHRVVGVVDCGLAINPKGVEAQIQGAITDGLSTALRAQITIEKGGTVQSSWNGYRWMTLDAMPVVEVHVIPSTNSPGGMGEPGYPSAPAAVANAIAAATGKRVRKFPIKIEELV